MDAQIENEIQNTKKGISKLVYIVVSIFILAILIGGGIFVYFNYIRSNTGSDELAQQEQNDSSNISDEGYTTYRDENKKKATEDEKKQNDSFEEALGVGIKITSPQDEQSFQTGETVHVVIETVGDFNPGMVTFGSDINNKVFDLDKEQSPFELDFTIPDDQPLGPITMVVQASEGSLEDLTSIEKVTETLGGSAIDSITINYEPQLDIVKIVADVDTIDVGLAAQKDDSRQLISISGVTQDGEMIKITNSTRLKFKVDDTDLLFTNLVSADEFKIYLIGNKPGSTTIHFLFEGKGISLPVTISRKSDKVVAVIIPSYDDGTAQLPDFRVGDLVYMDATRSVGEELVFEWSIDLSPEGSNAKLDGKNELVVNFRPDKPGEYRFELEVTDKVSNEKGNTAAEFTVIEQ